MFEPLHSGWSDVPWHTGRRRAAALLEPERQTGSTPAAIRTACSSASAVRAPTVSESDVKNDAAAPAVGRPRAADATGPRGQPWTLRSFMRAASVVVDRRAAIAVISTLIVRARADPAGLRSVRMAGVGPPDADTVAGHERGAVVEAAALPVHGPVRAVRPLPGVAVDDRARSAISLSRRRVRGTDRLPADVGAPRRQRRYPAIVAAVFAGLGVLRSPTESRATGTTCSARSRTR